jgi:general secretion pathway protein F
LEEGALELPALTVAMLAASRFVGRALIPAALLSGLAGILAARRVRGNPMVEAWWDRVRLGLPLVGPAYAALVNLRFSRTLALLLRAGVPLTEGMDMAGRATGSVWTRTSVAEQADFVRQGRSLADAMRAIAPFRGSLPGWIEAGEASGDLAGMLESAAVRYQQQWDRTVSRFLALLEPALVLVVGVFVLLVALSILLPLLSMNQMLH